MRIENWCGYNVRFVEDTQTGEWLAILDDICKVLDLDAYLAEQSLDPSLMVPVLIKSDWMIAVNEIGIYECMFTSRTIEARKFKRWAHGALKKLRGAAGLHSYEVLKMMDKDVQESIDHFLETLYYDPETDMIMQSVTIPGGDVDQVPYEDQDIFEGGKS